MAETREAIIDALRSCRNEELEAILESGKRRTIIEKITAQISKTQQEDKGIHTYDREFLYNMRDLGVILDKELPVDKQHIESIGIAKTDDEKLKNFLKVLKADNIGDGRSKEEEKENWARWTEKSLIDRALFIIEELSPITEELLTNEFLSLKVCDSPDLVRIVAVLFDAAVEQHGRQALFARLCAKQVSEELSVSVNVSLFRNVVLINAQEQFMDRNGGVLEEKRRAINAEMDEEKKNATKTELLETENAIRRKKHGTVLFIGHLYKQNVISCRILRFVFRDSLKSISDESNVLDEEAIDSAVAMMVIVGERLHTEFRQCSCPNFAARIHPSAVFPLSELDAIFDMIESARSSVSSELRNKIDRLFALRDNGWVASA